MAPVGEKADRDNVFAGENDGDKGENLWSDILGEVQSSSQTKLPASQSVLVLGENETGKTTLIAKLQGIEDPKKGSGLEYMYINVKDEYRDDSTRLGTWVLDGDLHHRGLLKFALTEENFGNTLVMLVVSMGEPWNLMESLTRWAEVLTTHIDRLKITPRKRQDYEENLVRQFQEYVEPDESSQRRQNPASRSDDEVLLPLGETTLSHNLGIPIVVVVTKSDSISTLEKESEFREEHFDFIQQYIRKFCLNYGAALFYTSVKEGKNCDLLYRYLVHKIYGFPFNMPALVVEKDAVFIPTGWDNEKKISICYENMSGMRPDDSYEDVIARPVNRKPMQRDADLTAEDEQLFLMKLQTQLSKAPATNQKPESPLRPSPSVQKTTVSSPRVGSSPSAPGGITPSPKKGFEGKPGQNTSEGVLASFFNSLLTKKTATGTSPVASRPTDRATVSRDAAAELDRMTRKKQPPLNNQTSNSTS